MNRAPLCNHLDRLARAGLPGLLVVLLLAAACGPGGEQQAEIDQEEIHQVLAGYLPLLGQAYATGDATVLTGVATPKEVAAVAAKIDEVAQRGFVFRPELRELTVEELDLWSPGHAYVTTLEVWDLSYFSLGTDQLLNESPGQTQRVKYQIARREGGWQVMSRQVAQSFE